MKRRQPVIPGRRPTLTQQALNALGEQFRAAFAQGDYAQAHKFAMQAWQATHSLQPLADFALWLMRLDQPQQA